MSTNIPIIPAAFSKEADQEFQRFLILMDRAQTEMMRLEMALTDLKMGYLTLTRTFREDGLQK
ncbi:MAG: hypothetical protein KBD90_06200 [Alphaproteobacteria bacterium]|nr:hypothetical protein [Alphaproteobacteria bacterium]